MSASEAPAPRQRSVRVIVVVAFLLRLAVILIGHTYKITPRRDHFQFGWEMGRLARSIAQGQGFSSPTDLPTGPSAWAPPLYPFLLGGVFKLFGLYSALSAFVILTINSAFAALTSWTLYLLAKRLYGEDVARAAAWTWALFPYGIYWPVRVVWETSLTTFLLTVALVLALKLAAESRPRLWIVFGLLWGVIMLTNTAVVSLLPFCLLWLLYRARHDRSKFSRTIIGAFACVLVAALVISPWLVRNYRVFGSFILIRDNLPLELHMANNDRSAGLWTRNEHPGNDPEAMRKFQQTGEYPFMQEKRQEFITFLREHPGQFARFSLERAAYFWIAPPQFANINGYDLEISRHVNFFLFAAFAFAGLCLTLRNRVPGGFLLAACLLFYPLPYYMVNPFPRYKHPIEPEMLLLLVYVLYQSRKVQIRWPRRP